MNDLISKQSAMDALNHELRCGAVINQCGLEVAYEVIEELPSAQPEIIYCKDCKYSEYHKLYGDRFCQYDNVVNVVPDLHYCGYAERKTDG